jgi:hypothetical protein
MAISEKQVQLPLTSMVEAMLLDELLEQDGVPHYIRSFDDRAYGALWQFKQGWGLVEIPARYASGVEALLLLIRRSRDDIAMSMEDEGSEEAGST